MIKLNYLIAVKNLLDRNKNRLDMQRDKKTKETEEMFYWLLSRMEAGIQGQYSPVYTVDITISAERVRRREDSTGAVYVPQYIYSRSDFYEVIQNVVNICNEVGGFLDNKFSAKFIKPEDEERRGKVYVYMKL